MRFFEASKIKTMNSGNYWRKLERKKYNTLIREANLDYIYDKKAHPEKYPEGDVFCPTNTPNRNPKQVPNGTWLRLLFKHLHKHFYN